MATNNEKLQELSVEEKLQHLYELQRIDTEIDKIKTLRGELPLEVQDLEDEIAGLETRLENLKNEISEADKSVTNKKQEITKSEELIKKYESWLIERKLHPNTVSFYMRNLKALWNRAVNDGIIEARPHHSGILIPV